MRTGAAVQRIAPQEHRSWARTLGDAFRKGRLNAKGAPLDRHAEIVAGKVESGRVKLFEHIALLTIDRIARGASQEDAEAFGHAYLALVRSCFASDLPALEPLARDEMTAQCLADPFQWDLSNLTPKELAECKQATARHLIALQRLDDALAMHLYTA